MAAARRLASSMVQVQPNQRLFCPYSILGVKHGTSLEQVEAAYNRLIKIFDEENFMSKPQSWVQAQQAQLAIENAYNRINNSAQEVLSEECAESNDSVPPKLGQLLVAAGIITLEQLDKAIAQQATLNLPLGEVLKGSSLITQMELDSFLLNQRLIKLPPDSPYEIGQRLMGLGLITEDMLRIALVEQRNSGKTITQILLDRHWLDESILDALTAVS